MSSAVPLPAGHDQVLHAPGEAILRTGDGLYYISHGCSLMYSGRCTEALTAAAVPGETRGLSMAATHVSSTYTLGHCATMLHAACSRPALHGLVSTAGQASLVISSQSTPHVSIMLLQAQQDWLHALSHRPQT